MWGLPFDANEQHVAAFFVPFRVLEGSVRLGTNPLGQRTGEAVVLFDSLEEAKQVCAEKYGQTIGPRWIGLEPIGVDKYSKFGVVDQSLGPAIVPKGNIHPWQSPLLPRTR